MTTSKFGLCSLASMMAGIVLSLTVSTPARAAGLGMEVNAGITYRGGDDDSTYYSANTSGVGFPAFGIGIYARTKKFALRNFLEYDSFGQKSGSWNAQRSILSWTSFASISAGDLFAGLGGGMGFESIPSGHAAYPWFGALVGFQLTKVLNINVRPMFNLGNSKIFGAYYMVVGIGIRVFEDD